MVVEEGLGGEFELPGGGLVDEEFEGGRGGLEIGVVVDLCCDDGGGVGEGGGGGGVRGETEGEEGLEVEGVVLGEDVGRGEGDFEGELVAGGVFGD